VKRRSGAVQTAGWPYSEKSGANGRLTRPKPHQSKLGKTRAARRSSEDHLRTTGLAATWSALLATRVADSVVARSNNEVCWPRTSNPVRLSSYVSRAVARREIAGLRPAFWQQGQSNNLLSYNQRRAVLGRDGD
jgi:hypothetical protein